MITKQEVVAACDLAINKRLESIQESIQSAKETSATETKSSAGDKFETTRAMMHLELERLGKQLNEAEQLQQLNENAAQSLPSNHIAFGSLVQTNNGIYFIGAGLGKLSLKDEVIFSISTSSPIGKLLLGKQPGDSIVFNGREIIIETLF